MNKKSVAIIGAGPSGITSAKYCVQYGLNPTVFDMNDQPGGLWVPGSKIWETLYCNFTKHSMVFSDFQWSKMKESEQQTSFYAHRDEIFNYLSSYIKHFELQDYFKCSTRVDSVKRLANSRWHLKWTSLNNMQHQHEREFDFLIVASGFNSVPNNPHIENSSEFNGLIMHSETYKVNDERLKGKRVLVIGSSNSSVEITSDLVGHAKSVSNLFSRPFWVLPKFIETTAKDDTSKKIVVPRDYLFYKREFVYTNQDKYKKYAAICPDQANKQTCPPNLYISPESKLPANFGVSEHYYKYVKEGKIVTYLNKAKRFVRDGVELNDGRLIQVDVVIYCTGFKLEMPFFENEILKTLKYQQDNYKNPIVLYNHTFHPDLENIAFIFLTRGGFFTGMELQSKWAALVLSGNKQLPDKEIMQRVIAENEKKREQTHPSVQFPHGLYVEVVDSLAKEIGVYPDLQDEKLKDVFNCCLVQPANFIYHENKDHFYQTIQVGEQIVKEGVKRDEKC